MTDRTARRLHPVRREPVRYAHRYEPRERRRLGTIGTIVGIAFVLALIGGTLGSAAVFANAFGMGDRFESLRDRVALFLDPPPDVPIDAPVLVTEPPDEPDPTATPEPTAPSSLAPGATPTPEPSPTASPTPAPVPTPVDVDLLRARGIDPERMFNSQVTKDWCAPSGVQMTLAILGLADTSNTFQTELASRIDEWESSRDSKNGGWGPNSMRLALDAHGATGYEVRAYKTRGLALRDAARAISATGAPVILLAWRGAHTWVMTGYKADSDPLVFPKALVSGAYILDPWYPRVSSIWGPSDAPGTFQNLDEMVRNFLPWKRPEGAYPDRDGLFIAVVPTAPVGDAEPLGPVSP